MAKRTLISWSTGKDSVWMLHELEKRKDLEITGLFRIVNEAFKRVTLHGVRMELLEEQAKILKLPLSLIKMPYPCTHQIYGKRISDFIEQARKDKIEQFAYGDIFVDNIRKHHEHELARSGITAIFPLWGEDRKELAEKMINSGLKASLTCVKLNKLDKSFAGREYNVELLKDLPENAEQSGEHRGDMHTFVYDGPMFEQPIDVVNGEVVERDGFAFADLMIRD